MIEIFSLLSYITFAFLISNSVASFLAPLTK